MKERPILFSDAMVRAILDGRKTQTRRIVKTPIPTDIISVVAYALRNGLQRFGWKWKPGAVELSDIKCPYGQVGDRLWVRECFGDMSPDRCDGMHGSDFNVVDDNKGVTRFILYRATAPRGFEWPKEEPADRWTTSIHMPRWASRITLEITSVRVERLQDISRDDCFDEGYTHSFEKDDPEAWFVRLWQSIYGPESWAANPWVWVIEFKQVTQ